MVGHIFFDYSIKGPRPPTTQGQCSTKLGQKGAESALWLISGIFRVMVRYMLFFFDYSIKGPRPPTTQGQCSTKLGQKGAEGALWLISADYRVMHKNILNSGSLSAILG
jgi:hypothetical protein